MTFDPIIAASVHAVTRPVRARVLAVGEQTRALLESLDALRREIDGARTFVLNGEALGDMLDLIQTRATQAGEGVRALMLEHGFITERE